MWLVILAGIVTAVAAWVAYEVTKSGGYPPYQDNTEDMGVKLDQLDTWPFPKDRP